MSCSNPQKMQQVFLFAMKNNLGFGFCFFVGDVIHGLGLWPFWLGLPGSRPQLLDGIF